MALLKSPRKLPPLGELLQDGIESSHEIHDYNRKSEDTAKLVFDREPGESKTKKIRRIKEESERIRLKTNKEIKHKSKKKYEEGKTTIEMAESMHKSNLVNKDSGIDVTFGNNSREMGALEIETMPKIQKEKRRKTFKSPLNSSPKLSAKNTIVDVVTDDYDNTDHDMHVRGSTSKSNEKALPVLEQAPGVASLSSIASLPKTSASIAEIDCKELALRMAHDYTRPKPTKKKRTFVDYVLFFKTDDVSDDKPGKRETFEKSLVAEQICVSRTKVEKYTYVELCCSFERLCQEAESLFLQMPLVGLSLHEDDSVSKSKWRYFKSEREVDDICIPFCIATKQIYDGIGNPDTFFRPALRSLLVHHILKKAKTSTVDGDDDLENQNVEALASLIHSGVYEGAFILHERSPLDPFFPSDPYRKEIITYPSETGAKETGAEETTDHRKDLHETWLANFKFQPLWKIRNYFGEKIALYFAWLGLLITSLWIPMLIGFVVFFYGIINKSTSKNTQSWTKAAFDNDLTPFFALIICLWGTIFLEVWKRKTAELAYKWDVDDFEDQEPNRPEFYGAGTPRAKTVLSQQTDVHEPYYSPMRKTVKTMGSMALTFFMVILVLGSLVSVILYRIIARVDWFSGKYKELLSNVTSSILNSVSIMLLGYFYKYLAKRLTEWENHRTQTQFDDSLILKLFGFQFVNSYASLYYIAFFRERTKTGVLGKGEKYTDSCGTDNDCMSLLSMQVGILMLMKPMPKFFTDICLPNRFKGSKVGDTFSGNESFSSDVTFKHYMDKERKKPSAVDFTLSEYTEKVIQYGYLMLFAAALPLAPLIALVTNLIDLRIDARRLLWLNKRPIPLRAQDIGTWYTILKLLNYVGVITNACIISLTSSFGRKYQTTTTTTSTLNSTTVNSSNLTALAAANNTTNYYRTDVTNLHNLWIIIIFQNVVMIVRFILSFAIPDVPSSVKAAEKRERFEVEKVLKSVGLRRGKRKTIAPAVTSRPRDMDGRQVNVENRSKRTSLKEKIKQISQKHPRSTDQSKAGVLERRKQKTCHVDVDNTNEVSQA
eukprot:gene6792-7557_t